MSNGIRIPVLASLVLIMLLGMAGTASAGTQAPLVGAAWNVSVTPITTTTSTKLFKANVSYYADQGLPNGSTKVIVSFSPSPTNLGYTNPTSGNWTDDDASSSSVTWYNLSQMGSLVLA